MGAVTRRFTASRPGDLDTLDEDQVRALQVSKRREATVLRATLNLQLTPAVRHELDGVAGPDGVETVALAAGLPSGELWRLLSGEYQPDSQTWSRIERVLTLCRATQATRTVPHVKRTFDRIAVLERELDLLEQRAQALSARSQPPGAADRSAAIPAGCPDPLQATTPEKFVAIMREYRLWMGNPSLRKMARRCDEKVSHSTLRTMLDGNAIPARLEHLESFVKALGGTDDDRNRWTTAWRRLTLSHHAPPAQREKEKSLHLIG